MKDVIKFCRKALHAIDVLNSRIGIAGGIFLILLTLIVAYEVVMRYLFNRPTMWVFEVSQLLLMVMVMLTLGYALKKERHVAMSAVVDLLPDKMINWIDGLTSILGAMVCFVIAYQGLLMTLSSLHTHQRLQDTGLPLWPIKLTVFIGFFLISLQFIVRGIGRFEALLNQKKDG